MVASPAAFRLAVCTGFFVRLAPRAVSALVFAAQSSGKRARAGRTRFGSQLARARRSPPIHLSAFLDRQLRRSACHGHAGAPAAPNAVCAGACNLLHKLDVFRLGGLAAVSGLDFLTIYIGPILILTLGAPLLRHIIALSKAERITSVADFLSARYGKNERWPALAAMIAVVGVVPYIALQLKAVSARWSCSGSPGGTAQPDIRCRYRVHRRNGDGGVCGALRHATVDTSEHQDGLMLAVATESVVKLVAFVVVGCFVTFMMFDGFGDLFTQAAQSLALWMRSPARSAAARSSP
jgi:hypothetical protein